MKKQIFNLLLIILTVFISCNNDDDQSNSTVKISGFVISENVPEENVKVSIGNFENLTAITNSDGFFQIEGVTVGEHDLILYKNNISADSPDLFVQKTFKISANADTELKNLTLPNPVVLETPSNITANSALITWNKSQSEGFREYKLYRHNSSGLDETTGTLVHVSTDINDTSFLDETLNSSETYFYRVYVLDEFGQIGGSNIITFETNSVPVLKNGSFEEINSGTPSFWDLIPNDGNNPQNTIAIDNTQFTEGQNSIKFHNADVGGCYEQWIKQDIENNILVKGATYRLTMDYKSDFTEPDRNNVSLIIRNFGDLDLWLYMDVDFFDDGQWRNNVFEFTLPEQFSNSNIEVHIHFCTIPTGSWWLDNISIDRIN